VLSVDHQGSDGRTLTVDQHSSETSGSESSARNELGRELRKIAADTYRLAAEIRPMLDDTGALDELVQDGECASCRIAVIGQVKAGKSTLVNALIERPRFLPTDVNPWTAVVTSLHFGQPSDAGAIYQFFDETDWQRLAAGGRLQELSQRLGLTLDAETLTTQVALMRQSAERRLGPQFRQLLGKQHRFSSASAEVLERYVCVGDLDGEPINRLELTRGRFTDITKSADLYFDLAPFAYATTIVDTPGTNDPFLVRDTISREALESADACILVLNAQQALSSSDMSLLRLLHGLQKNRLVVFINRVDLLANPVEDGKTVVAHVRRRLAVEYPGASIPVIAGSAIWAEREMSSDDKLYEEPQGRLAWEAIHALARGARAQAAVVHDEAARRAEIMRTSGLDDLLEILSRLVVLGPTMLHLQRDQAALHDMVSKVYLAARGELYSLKQRTSSMLEDQAAASRRRAEELDRLHAAPTAVAKLVASSTQNLGLVKEAAMRRLDAALRDVVRRHALSAREMLLAEPGQGRHEHVWQYDTSPLRRDLAQQFHHYRYAAEQLQKAERSAKAAIFQEIQDLVPDNALVAEDAPIHLIDPAPSISALGQTVTLDLADQWRAWWRLWQGPKQRARKLEEVVSAEFHKVVDALVEAAAVELDVNVALSAQRLAQLGRDLTAMANRRRTELEAYRRDPARRDAGGLVQEYQARQLQLTQRLQDCDRIADALKLLFSQCGALGRAAGRATSS
jgi:signal recognition particle receptor subunit beta